MCGCMSPNVQPAFLMSLSVCQSMKTQKALWYLITLVIGHEICPNFYMTEFSRKKNCTKKGVKDDYFTQKKTVWMNKYHQCRSLWWGKLAFGACRVDLQKILLKAHCFLDKFTRLAKILHNRPKGCKYFTSACHQYIDSLFSLYFSENGFNSVFRLQNCTHRGSAFLQVKLH